MKVRHNDVYGVVTDHVSVTDHTCTFCPHYPKPDNVGGFLLVISYPGGDPVTVCKTCYVREFIEVEE